MCARSCGLHILPSLAPPPLRAAGGGTPVVLIFVVLASLTHPADGITGARDSGFDSDPLSTKMSAIPEVLELALGNSRSCYATLTQVWG